MIKRILIYLFCLSITLQSALGQFLLVDQTTGTFSLLPPVASLLTGKTEASHIHTVNVMDKDINETEENEVPENNCGSLKFVRDSIMEHLFSPSNCPNESSHIFTIFSFLYIKNNINLIVIEERISTFVHFYASFFRNIQIGLSIKKIIYPFHNFY
ncbi:MAG: hypothetical protein WCZ43_00755 [Proteiniphilum sp.]